jgi:hypothetical protein
MSSLRRTALGLSVAGAIVLMALALGGAVAPQLALIGAVAVCGAMAMIGQRAANSS